MPGDPVALRRRANRILLAKSPACLFCGADTVPQGNLATCIRCDRSTWMP